MRSDSKLDTGRVFVPDHITADKADVASKAMMWGCHWESDSTCCRGEEGGEGW